MRILKALEHEGQIFACDDKVKSIFDNGVETIGKIKWYGECNMDGGVKDAVGIGEYYVALLDMVSISKI